MAVRITCITKDNGQHYDRHEAIQYLGWVNEQTRTTGRSSREQMIQFLENRGAAFTRDGFGNVAYLVIRISPYGNKYVKTIADGKESDNLLALPEC
jgi:hypothetical protein